MSIKQHDPFQSNFDSLDEFADHISDVLKCPITIEDANHRLLAYSTHQDEIDPARISTIIGRRVPEKVINNLWKQGAIPALLQSREPIRVENINEIGLGNRVAISIWKNDEVLGFIWALEVYHKLQDSELILLKSAAKAAKNKLLQLQIRKNKKEERSQELFWKIITDHVKEADDVHMQFQQVQLTPPTLFSVLVFRFHQEITDDMERKLSYLLQTTQQVQVSLYTTDFNKLILLISLKNRSQPLQQCENFIEYFTKQTVERFNLSLADASSGNIYESLDCISKSYKEALTVLSIKKRFPKETQSIYTYQSLGIYQFLDVLLEKRQRDGFTNQTVEKLVSYDQKHQSNLVETIEIFLDRDQNLHEAAKALNIHINTLNYRLKRIQEIGELNLKNPNQKITLYLDIKLARYAESLYL
ncbi:helix-turn-helix domain-containing protein [Priestia filamentosa]|uniref:PucR family transcriptional regulator n=1 Tax=Priestia filamentosa TaxID=1402861 RepID=UPI00397B610F